MLNKLWAGMILVSILFAAFTGRLSQLTEAALQSGQEAISLCITMAGVVGLWTGLMEIAGKSGMIMGLTHAMNPFLNYFFPEMPQNHPAREYISTNLIANILGLGWACTPAGLKAMEALAELERERGNFDENTRGPRYASREMCDFLILNISSLQLIPVNIIAYRSQYGSRNPAGIILPAILATLISTITALIYCRYKGRRYHG